MARLRPLRPGDAVSTEVRQMLEAAAAAFGEPLISSGIQAYAPEIMKASRQLGAAPARSGLLPAQLRALVCLRAAQLVGCPF